MIPKTIRYLNQRKLNWGEADTLLAEEMKRIWVHNIVEALNQAALKLPDLCRISFYMQYYIFLIVEAIIVCQKYL